MFRIWFCFVILFLPSVGVSQGADEGGFYPRPKERSSFLPSVRWEHRPESDVWTRSALAALGTHGAVLMRSVPADIADWCPAYPQADHHGRAAFWVGLISTLAKHESTYRPTAVGGGGKWYGLLQILPATARGYKCRASTGDALKNGSANLSCAIRIMAVTVPRDGVVSRGMRGVAADWGPFHSRKKRTDMMAWTKRQDYCSGTGPAPKLRPKMRPQIHPNTRSQTQPALYAPQPIRPQSRPDRLAMSAP